MYVVWGILAIVLIYSLIQKNSKDKFLPVYGYLTGTNDRLYRLLDVVKGIFSKAGIPFVITGNTLLSAVEKQQLTQGQTQATILIPHEYLDELLTLSDELVDVGFGLTDLPDGGYRLSSAISMPVVADTAILIYPVKLEGDKWLTNSKFQGYNEWYESKDLFPAKMYKLGILDIPGPSNPLDYLQRNYWSDDIYINNAPKKRWYQISPQFYKLHKLPIISNVDYVNGIRIDQRLIPGKTSVILGNGRNMVVPDIKKSQSFPKLGRWRQYMWT